MVRDTKYLTVKIVDPAKNRITVWNFEKEDTDDFTFSDQVKANIYTDLVIDFSQI